MRPTGTHPCCYHGPILSISVAELSSRKDCGHNASKAQPYPATFVENLSMKTVKHLLTEKAPGVISIGPDASVFDALTLMAEKDIGALVVLDGEKLVGILSERDYARKVALLGKSSKEILVRDIMTHKVLCVTQAHTVDECMGLMTQKRCRHLPVVQDKHVIGVLSIGDLVKETITDQQLKIQQLESYIMS